MEWFRIIAAVSLGICLLACLRHVARLIRLGKPVDYSVAAGDTSKAVIYSFTGAMSPGRKESAYLHLPTYTAGLVYHLGTFFAILIFLLLLSGIGLPGKVAAVSSVILGATTLSGVAILAKRFLSPALRSLSNPDDYISNSLVTLFQGMSALVLAVPEAKAVYFIVSSVLLIWVPVGKLRHAVYFFAARYHLGYFFGYRGTWPPLKSENH